MFSKIEAVICTSCKFKDSKNSFKERQVTINANIKVSDNIKEVSDIFTVQCAKCSNCGKILFTRMSKFKKLKKDAEKYFKELYPNSEINLLNIKL